MKRPRITLGLTLVGIVAIGAACSSVLPPSQTPPQFNRAPWYLLAEDEEDLMLGVVRQGGDCDELAGIDVIESETTVEIRAYVENLRADGCFMVLVREEAPVKLDAPLGDRELVGCLLGEDPRDVRVSCAAPEAGGR